MIIKGDEVNLKDGDKVSLGKLVHAIRCDEALGYIANLRFEVVFLLNNKQEKLEINQPVERDIFDNIHIMKKPIYLCNVEGYLSTHLALDEIENKIKLETKATDYKLETKIRKLNNAIIEYVYDCRQILNSGSIDIPVITPEIKKLESKLCEALKGIEHINQILCGSKLINACLEKVKYNYFIENALYAYLNILDNKYSSPAITILQSSSKGFKVNDCILFSQVNSIINKFGDNYGQIKYRIAYFLNNKMQYFIASAYINGCGSLLEQLDNSLVLYLQKHCELDNLELAMRKESAIIAKYPIIYDEVDFDNIDERLNYLDDIGIYVRNSRALLNSGNLKLPEIPKEPDNKLLAVPLYRQLKKLMS